MQISFNPVDGRIITWINDELIYFLKDMTLSGKRVGFICHGKDTIIKQILSVNLNKHLN